MDPLAELLTSLSTEGQHDSSSTFTLDLFRSHQRLRESLLEQPGAYLLKLVQAAVATAPDEVRVVQRVRDVQVSFPLEVSDPVFAELPEAFLNPLDARWNRATRHLALGLHAATGQGMEHVAVVRASPTQLTGFLATPHSLRPFELSGSVPGWESCHIRLRKRQAPGWLARLGLGPRVAEAAAMRQLAYSACPIYLDGVRLPPARIDFPQPARTLAESFFPHFEGLADRHLISRQPLAGLIEAPSARARPPALFDLGSGSNKDLAVEGKVILHQWRAPDHTQSLFPGGPPPAAFVIEDDRLFGMGARPSPYDLGSFSKRGKREVTPTLFVHGAESFSLGDCRRPTLASHAFLSLPCPSPRHTGTLQLVLDGLALQPESVQLGYPGAYALVADPAIRTDLSQTAALADGHYDELLAYLRGQVKQMMKEARTAVRFGDRLGLPASQGAALRKQLGLQEVW